MEQFTTQCPNCGTSFRVTQEQLQVANGSVRCGSCMHIFQAASHQSNAPRQNEDPALDFSYDNPDNSTDAETNDTEENERELSESFLEMDKWQNDESSAFQEMDDGLTEGKASDEQWARDLLDNLDSEAATTPVSSNSQQAQKNTRQSTDKKDNFSALDGDEELAESFEFTDENTSENSEDTEESAELKDELIHRIEAAPVELHLDTSSRLLKNSLWGLSILAALVLLLAQTLYFNFNTLAVNPQYRPWYALLCNELSCELPKLGDIKLIKASNLMVRTHPDRKNALIVDAIVTNRANYKQSFPLLELVFTDLQGNIVAGRIFQADEYLSGELKGSTSMPRQRPIHLSLELLDPGPQASSYSLHLHAKKTS